MRRSEKNLAEILHPLRRIDIAVIGRKTGRRISMPVWHVVEGKVLYLLPVNGTATQWFKNLLHNPAIRISARRGRWVDLRAKPTIASKQVSSVIRKFGAKYKASVVKKLYSKFDAAVRVPLR